MATNIYIPNELANSYDLGSIVYKYVNGKKQYYEVISMCWHGYKSKKTHTKFVGQKIKNKL